MDIERRFGKRVRAFAERAQPIFKQYGWTYLLRSVPTVEEIEQVTLDLLDGAFKDYPEVSQHTCSFGRVVVQRYAGNNIDISLDIEEVAWMYLEEE